MTRHALILAAGKGSRFGYPKSWISLHGTPLVQAHINAIKSHMPVRVIVSDLHEANTLDNCTIIHNPHGTSMMSSIQAGLETLEDIDHVLIVPVDTVPIRKTELQALITMHPPAVLSHQNQAGHPIWLSVKSIRSLPPLHTLRSLSERAQHCEGTRLCLMNFNYPQDWIDVFGQRPRRWNKNTTPIKR